MKIKLRTWGTVIMIILIVSLVIVGGIATGTLWKNTVVIKVFHAGSLTLPFERIKAKFEQDFRFYRPPGSLVVCSVEVQLEPAGSIRCVRKIIDIGKEADVLASADYSLIPEMMMPEYADWYLKFAKNKMVLAYTNNSLYADEINSTNWYRILRKVDVRWGFSNPNMDPCGYRTPWVIQLAELEYNDGQIFEDLIEANSAITMTREGDTYLYTAPEDLGYNTERLVIKDKSVELITLLQLGGLDYAFEYLSAAVQHNLNYVKFPESIDLSSDKQECTEVYGKMKAVTVKGNITVKPIHYGVTVPKNAPHPELAEQFVKYMIDEFGLSVFTEMGQPPLSPALAYNLDEVPIILRSYCIEEER